MPLGSIFSRKERSPKEICSVLPKSKRQKCIDRIEEERVIQEYYAKRDVAKRFATTLIGGITASLAVAGIKKLLESMTGGRAGGSNNEKT